MSIRVVGVILLALIVAAVSGWFAGAAGRSALEAEQVRSGMRAEFAESRALVLEGKVSLFLSNVGNAVQSFQRANVLIARLQQELREMGHVEQAGRLELAASNLGDAQRLAATFDMTGAQAAADQALQALQAAAGGR